VRVLPTDIDFLSVAAGSAFWPDAVALVDAPNQPPGTIGSILSIATGSRLDGRIRS
jgi:hypothetical protein